jgi:hypothetical protein
MEQSSKNESFNNSGVQVVESNDQIEYPLLSHQTAYSESLDYNRCSPTGVGCDAISFADSKEEIGETNSVSSQPPITNVFVHNYPVVFIPDFRNLETQRTGYDFQSQGTPCNRTGFGPLPIPPGNPELSSYPNTIGQYNRGIQYQQESSGLIPLSGPSPPSQQNRTNEFNTDSSAHTGSREQDNRFTQPPGIERGLPGKEMYSVACLREAKLPPQRRSLRKSKQQNFAHLLLLERGKTRKKRQKERERSESSSSPSRSDKARKRVSHKLVQDEPIDSSSHSSDFKEPKKVQRGRRKRRSHSSGLERSTVECVTKKAKRGESDSRTSRESPHKRKSHEQKRIKTSSRKHVSSSTEIKPIPSKLTKSNEDINQIVLYRNESDAKRSKNLQKKVEFLIDYRSTKEAGKIWADELFKAFGIKEDVYTNYYKSLSRSTFLNYQFGWGLFLNFVYDDNCCEYINKDDCQIVYNNFLSWMSELSEESGIPEDGDIDNQSMSVTLPNPKALKNIKPSSFGGVKAAVSWLFKLLFKVDVAKDFGAKALSKSFLRTYPPRAKYKNGVWDASIVINYYRNYTESFSDLSYDDKVFSLQEFFLVKTTILLSFFSLSRPRELVQIRTDADRMIREDDDGRINQIQ